MNRPMFRWTKKAITAASDSELAKMHDGLAHQHSLALSVNHEREATRLRRWLGVVLAETMRRRSLVSS